MCGLDAADFSVLCNNSNTSWVALGCSISYHSGPDPGTLLVVEGETLSTTRRTASFLFKIHMEKDGTRQPVATMKSVLYRTGKPIDPEVEQ